MDNYSVALGIFDGVHLGHQCVIGKALSYRERGLKPAVFTFSVEDMEFKHGHRLNYIIDNASKLEILKSMGVESIVCPNFNEVHNMSGEDFARDVLHTQMHAKVVTCGKKFRFGKGASCGTDDLKTFGDRYGFSVEIVEPILFGDSLVSSSVIRGLISSGDIKTANRLLGHDYTINGVVVHGNALGRTIGIPTINQRFGTRQVIPKFGVYSSSVVVDGIAYKSMTNIGVKPTISSDNIPVAETHIVGYTGDLYGREVRVSLRDYIRPEKRFDSLEELKLAINNDISICVG
jgi:riboflavin kinase/FMN adenylyltransferase